MMLRDEISQFCDTPHVSNEMQSQRDAGADRRDLFSGSCSFFFIRGLESFAFFRRSRYSSSRVFNHRILYTEWLFAPEDSVFRRLDPMTEATKSLMRESPAGKGIHVHSIATEIYAQNTRSGKRFGGMFSLGVTWLLYQYERIAGGMKSKSGNIRLSICGLVLHFPAGFWGHGL